LRAWLGRHRFLLLVLLAHAAFWGAVNVFVSPHPDYIDHWVQSRIWSLSYYEHPPMVAWFIRAMTFLYGSSEVGLQAGALTVNLLLLAAIYGFAVQLFGLEAGRYTLLGLEATTFFTSKALSIQTEQPLALFWVGSLWAMAAYLRSGRARWILLAGLLAGLGALAKYTMILFYVGLLFYGLLVPGRRKELVNPWQIAGGLLALAVFLPVIVWNYQHDWVSFRFQFSKSGADTAAVPGRASLEFLIGTLFFYSPVLFGWGLWRMARRWRHGAPADSAETLLAVMTWLPLVFFTAAVARATYADPHWTVLSAVCLLVWAGRELAQLARRRRAFVTGLVAAALLVNAGLLGLVMAHAWRPFLPVVPAYDPTRQLVGWREAGAQAQALLERDGMPAPRYVASVFYPLAAHFSLHLPSQPLPYSFSREGRNIWDDPARMNGDNTIVVCEPASCAWMRQNMRERFGWKDLREVGTVRPVVWGTPRETTVILREAR
jgi:4-amino-4-deoxy-L-arabinose transferase-like glycosyltransferase